MGLILAIVNKNKVKEFLAQGGQLAGKAKVGKILGTLGLVFSIITLVIAVIYIIIFAIVGGAAASGSFNY